MSSPAGGSFERVLSEVKARYLVGLTATLQRRDGHDAITQMQLGPVRFRVDAKSQAARRPFDHKLIVRKTEFRMVNGNAQHRHPGDLPRTRERRGSNIKIVDDVIATSTPAARPFCLPSGKITSSTSLDSSVDS
jgi:hypothetical protein